MEAETENKKLIIRVEADIPKVVEDARAFLRPITMFFQVIGYMIARRVPSHTAKSKNAVYTAESAVFTPQERTDTVSESERVGAVVDDNYKTESYVQCANPSCDEMFAYQKRGNQEKKYCSNECKDIVNNEKKRIASNLGY